jgi:hypothetical protein
MLFSFVTGGIVVCVAVVLVFIAIQSQRPLFISPLPALQAFASPSNDDEQETIIKKDLKDKSIAFTTVESKDSLYTIQLENGAWVTLSAKKDIIMQISSLQFVLSRLTMEGRQFRTLDLQYDKPIIVFKE